MKVLVTNGISELGKNKLEKAGFEVVIANVAPVQLVNYIVSNNISVLLVKSIAILTKEIVECDSLKLIGAAQVDTDNLLVKYAKSKGLHVVDTPSVYANAVAELVFAHLFGMTRFLHQANREMPLEGDSSFNMLSKMYEGAELKGKTLGVIGLGNIGKATAKIALGIGMKVVANDTKLKEVTIDLEFFDGQTVKFQLESIRLNDLLTQSDFISIHIPQQRSYLIGKEEFDKMKDGVGVINTAHGSILDEVALTNALESDKVKYAALDVFEKEPQPEIQLLMNPDLSLSPHIGGRTIEAEKRKGIAFAEQIIKLLK